MRTKKNGFTLIELLAVIIILGVLMLIAIPAVTEYISNSRKNAFKETASSMASLLKSNYFSNLNIGETTTDIEYYYNDGVESSSVENKTLEYKGKAPKDGIARVTMNGDVAIALHDGTYCAVKSYIDKEVTVEKKPLSECSYDYSSSKDVNIPKLAKGMTPIKWNGTTWVDTVEGDDNWYSYDTTNKKWANARTQDGSMWVWIPRYIYKIKSGWGVNTTGTIEVQFSKGIDDTIGGTVTLNTGTTSNASNNKWTNHPGFKFGNTELTGIWIAKFEPTAAEGIANQPNGDWTCLSTDDNVTTKTVKILPNVLTWRCITPGNAFTAIRNMEKSSVYGWNTASGALQTNGIFTIDNNGVDTHLTKNIEWGAVVYLATSQYGVGSNEVWINNNTNYMSGCAGTWDSDSAYSGCQNTYENANGVKASTTRNIYGVYDMSGSSAERVAAYLNNSNPNIDLYGSSLYTADAKYKDVYQVSPYDEASNNYNHTLNGKGDALYETSTSSQSWFNDYAIMANTDKPFLLRGGDADRGSAAGLFYFESNNGYYRSSFGFRPVLLVKEGL